MAENESEEVADEEDKPLRKMQKLLVPEVVNIGMSYPNCSPQPVC